MMEFNFFRLVLLIVLLSTHTLSHEIHYQLENQTQHQRNCFHDQYVEPGLIEMMKIHHDTPKRTQRLVNGLEPDGEILNAKSNKMVSPRPIRIKADFQLEGISEEQKFFIQEILVPMVIEYFRKILYVRKPVEGNLHLPYYCKSYFTDYPDYCVTVHETCGSATLNPDYMSDLRLCDAPFEEDCVTTPGGPGAEDADFILYFTTDNDSTCRSSSSAVGSGGFCIMDTDNWYGSLNRPLAGFANLCPKQLTTDPDAFGDLLDTTVHEVFHALLMSHELMNHFVDDNNFPLKDVVLESSIGLYVASPAVVRSSRSMFACDLLAGAALEDDGGDGTANSHWERRQFLGELMVGNSVSSTRDIISEVTLALAEDSGWYLPNYKYAGIIPEIHKNGCEYIVNQCSEPSPKLEDIFCWPDQVETDKLSVCTYDHTAVGYCNTGISLLGDCNLVLPYSNMECNNVEHGYTSSIDIGTRNRFGARCFPVASTNLYRTDGKYIVWVTGPIGATCFDAICHGNDLYVKFDATDYNPAAEVRCPSGEYVDLTKVGIGYTEGIIGPCPDNDSVCNAWGCPNDCNLKGDCYQGRCYCHVGFFGKDCSSYSCTSEKVCFESDTTCDAILGICVPKSAAIDYETVVSYHEDIQKAVPLSASSASTEQETVELAVYYPDLISYKPPFKKISEDHHFFSGTVANNGYFAFCEVFVLKRDSASKEKDPSVVKTDLLGRWEFIFDKEGFAFLDSHSGDNCIDMLSGASVRWSLRAPLEVQYVTPITSLGCIKDKNEYWTEDGYEFDSKILRGLEIEDQKVLFEDNLMKVFNGGTGHERRLVATSLIINNIVSQVGAFVTGKTNKLDVVAYDILYELRSNVRDKNFIINSFKDAGIMESIIKEVDKNTDSSEREELGSVIAEINQIALDLADQYTGPDLVVRLGALSYITEEYLVPDASKMNSALNSNDDEYFIMFKNINLRELVDENVKPLDNDFVMAMQNENLKKSENTNDSIMTQFSTYNYILTMITFSVFVIMSMVIILRVVWKNKSHEKNKMEEKLIN